MFFQILISIINYLLCSMCLLDLLKSILLGIRSSRFRLVMENNGMSSALTFVLHVQHVISRMDGKSLEGTIV
jgi:hypothetical protein